MELYPIDPKCRSSLVISLCEAMRQENDYSGIPLLADALEDSGYFPESCKRIRLTDDQIHGEITIYSTMNHSGKPGR